MEMPESTKSVPVPVKLGELLMEGQLNLPPKASGVVLFPHGRGTSRGQTDTFLAATLCEAGLAVFLLDLLTAEEADLDARKAAFRFDTDLLAGRLVLATTWLADQPATGNLPIGYLATGYAAAVALRAAAKLPRQVRAVVTHDAVAVLADKALPDVPAPTLLIGGMIQTPAEQPGAADKKVVDIPSVVAVYRPEEVARLAVEWFAKHLVAEVAGA